MERSLKQETTIKQSLHLSLSMQKDLLVLQMPLEELSLFIEEQIEKNPLLIVKDSKKKFLSLSFEPPHTCSLFEHLMNQIQLVIEDPKQLEIAEWIIGNLDEKGFFTEQITPKEQEILSITQGLDPPGVGARNLQECLLLQLKALGKKDSVIYEVISNHFEALLNKRYKLLSQKYEKKEENFIDMIYKHLSYLTPYPGLSFHAQENLPLIPDLLLIETKQLKVVSNDGFLPDYILSVPPTQLLDPEESLLVSEWVAQAKWLEKALCKRKKTLIEVATALVVAQKDFLLKQSSSLKALSIQDLSSMLSIHESTVHRAICGKNIACSYGIIPLKSLLSRELSEDISSDRAKKVLQQLIQEEDKQSPLSDEQLLQAMQKKGIPCARRTLTKYRTSLSIPPKRLRKLKAT